jgi:oxygen-independent coproporphyrinogen-3 oxidase
MVEVASLYVHIPFCKKRCYYCDFNTVAGNDAQIEGYFQALDAEICHITKQSKLLPSIHSLYFGGGTPSYVHEKLIQDLMSNLRNHYDLLPHCEITIEANPGTLTQQKLDSYRESGFNRLSLGVQSAVDAELARLGRIHSFADVRHNVLQAQEAGFDNISLDLIFGVPGQTMQSWMESLEKITSLDIQHLSLYSLTIEEGTPFGEWLADGRLIEVSGDEMADQYNAAQTWLAEQQFEQYEISNWRRIDPRKDFTSRHNCQYWLNEPYYGFGLGAHSCIGGERLANTDQLSVYLQACTLDSTGKHAVFPACIAVDKIDAFTEMQETMMLGLRLIQQGVSKSRFFRRFGVEMQAVFAKEIQDLIRDNLVEWIDADRLCLTSQGILLGNQAFIKFV